MEAIATAANTKNGATCFVVSLLMLLRFAITLKIFQCVNHFGKNNSKIERWHYE